MSKVLKWIGIVLGALVGLILVASVILNISTASRINHRYDFPAEAIPIPTDDDSLARGEYLANAICTECHGEDLAGKLLFEEPGIAAIYAPNITPSESGVGDFSDADYIRALRHSIDPDGKPYVSMPAEIFIHWSAEDLGSTIAYLKNLPPNDNQTPDQKMTFVGRALLPTGVFGEIFPAEYVDHSIPFPTMPEIGATAEYGQYFAAAGLCTDCHGEDLRGGPPPPCCPEYGEIPSLEEAAGWSTEEFIAAVTTGVTPDSEELNPEIMPWALFANYHSVELEAIHRYIKSMQ